MYRIDIYEFFNVKKNLDFYNNRKYKNFSKQKGIAYIIDNGDYMCLCGTTYNNKRVRISLHA